jgi:RimJ/RimL family protein N-acetyltransferase
MTAVTLTNTPVLETDRLTLRAPGPQDWPAFRAFIASPRSSFVRTEELDDGKAWRAFCHIVGTWVARGYGSFVFTLKGDDTGLGLTGPWHPIDWPERELGWTVWSDAAEGKGIAFEAAAAARDHAFRDLGWHTAVSYINPVNTRSAALAQRLGASVDPTAAFPGTGPCLVYRHPSPSVRA